jgi:hypothetical protein
MEYHKGKPRGARDVRVDPAHCPGWISGLERLPAPGEHVHTSEGPAVVVKVLGKTGGHGRLLHLAMDDGRREAFFAAAANVMVHPEERIDEERLAALQPIPRRRSP